MRLKYLFALFALTGAAFAADPQPSRYFQNNGGYVDHISPLLIPDRNASAITNITMDDRGQLSKRNGYTILNTTGGLTTSAVSGAGYHTAATGSNFFAVQVGTTVWRTSNSFGGTWTDVTSTVTVTNSAANLAQTTSITDKLVFCNDSDKPYFVQASGNALALAESTFSAAKTCATYGTYLVVANTTESAVANPSRVRWSDINTTESFPANNYIDVEPNDGDSIVSIVGFEDSVYIFKHHSIHRMMITGLDGADAFLIRPIARNIGSWAKDSVKVIPGQGIFFLAQNTLYQLNTSQASSFNDSGLTPIGDPIQRTFDAVPRAMWARAVSAVYPKRYQYWLACSNNGTTNNQVLVYDYIQKAWTIYTGMTINALSQAEDSTGGSVLISGDTSGNIYKQDNGTSDSPANVTTAIAASYTTADLNMGMPDYTKAFKYLYVFSQVDVNTTVTVEAAYDYSYDYEFKQGVNLGSTAVPVYDTAVYDTDAYPATQYKVTRLELNRSARAVKLRYSNSSANSLVGIIGWSIVYTPESWRE